MLYSLLRLFDSDSYTRKVVSSLKGKGFPKTYYAGGLSGLHPAITAKRLLLTNSMGLASEIMTKKTKHYFLLDGNYEIFCFVTNDAKGELLLRFLCDPDLCNQLDKLLSSDLCPAD